MTSSTNFCVAVVDDDESLCRSFSRLLHASGIRAVSYLSAENFLADSKRPQFDCVVLDIQLGGMTGIELNQQLTAAGSPAPVIFITAYDEPEIREQALRTPCVAYLRKSEPAEVVLSAIRKALDSNSSRSSSGN